MSGLSCPNYVKLYSLKVEYNHKLSPNLATAWMSDGAGFGNTDSGPDNSASVKMKSAQLQLNDFGSCNLAYGGILDSSLQICGGVPFEENDTCNGDSGGPLFGSPHTINLGPTVQLLGITSHNANGVCGEVLSPTVYLYIPAYTGWIWKTLLQNVGYPWGPIGG